MNKVPLRLIALWIWCAAAIAFFWLTSPWVRFHGEDGFAFFLSWVWFAGPHLAVASSVALLVCRPAALPLVRTMLAAHLGGALTLSAVLVFLRWQEFTEVSLSVVIVSAVGVVASAPALLLAPSRPSDAVIPPRSWSIAGFAALTTGLLLVLWSYANILWSKPGCESSRETPLTVFRSQTVMVATGRLPVMWTSPASLCSHLYTGEEALRTISMPSISCSSLEQALSTGPTRRKIFCPCALRDSLCRERARR